MKCRPYLAVLVGAALICGCDEQSTPTAVTEGIPTFNFTNGPEQASHVYRFQNDNYALVGWDVEEELVSIHTNIENLCGGEFGEDIEPVDSQDNETPNEVLIRLRLAKEIFIRVYDFTGLEIPGDVNCTHARDESRFVAEGLGNFKLTDNYVIWDDDARTNSYGANSQATLQVYGTDETTHYTYQWRSVWNTDPRYQKLYKETINLSWDPR